MRRAWVAKLLGMAVIVPLLLAAVLPAQTSLLVCRFTGVIMPARNCCPDEAAAPSSQASVRDQECCAIRNVTRPTLLAEHAPRSGWGWEQGDALAPAAILPMRLLVAGPSSRILRRQTSAFRPPPLSYKQSLLI